MVLNLDHYCAKLVERKYIFLAEIHIFMYKYIQMYSSIKFSLSDLLLVVDKISGLQYLQVSFYQAAKQLSVDISTKCSQ